MAKDTDRTFIATISNDCKTLSLHSNEPARFLADLLGQDVKVTISKVRRTKSSAQLGYWFGVLEPMCRQFWADSEGTMMSRKDAHTRMMYECVGAKMVPKKLGNFNCYVLDRPHLSDATVDEVSNYIEAVVLYLNEQGLEVPEAGDTGTLTDY